MKQTIQLDKNSLDQKSIDFRGCECYMPCVKDGWIDGNKTVKSHKKADQSTTTQFL